MAQDTNRMCRDVPARHGTPPGTCQPVTHPLWGWHVGTKGMGHRHEAGSGFSVTNKALSYD